jgi:hypothetical protein
MADITPGRWHWWTANSDRTLRAEQADHSLREVIYAANSLHDGRAYIYASEADMALIAAAPRLLVLLRRVMRHGGQLSGDDYEDIQLAIEQAESGRP